MSGTCFVNSYLIYLFVNNMKKKNKQRNDGKEKYLIIKKP